MLEEGRRQEERMHAMEVGEGRRCSTIEKIVVIERSK